MSILSSKTPFHKGALNVFFILIPLSFFLPLRLFNVALIAFFGVVALQLALGKIRAFNWRCFLWLIVPMLILLYGVIIDIVHGYARESMRELESFLPILFFPLLLNFIDVTKERMRLSKVAFFSGSVLASLVCLGSAVWKNMTDHNRIVHNWNFIDTMKFYDDNPIGIINWGFFLYSEFSFPINFHPVYLGTYFVVAILFGVSFLRQSTSTLSKIILVLSLLLLVVEIFLLNGRMPILILFVLIFSFIIYEITHNIRRGLWWKTAAIIGILAIILTLIPVSLYRIQSAITLLREPTETLESSHNNLHRIVIWKQAIGLAGQHFWKGYGLFGGEQAIDSMVLKEERHRYNAHNQYLMLLLATGIFGLLVFVYHHSRAVFLALRNRNYIYAAFLGILLLAILTENFISRHRGVVLYSYFHALFFSSLHWSHNRKKLGSTV